MFGVPRARLRLAGRAIMMIGAAGALLGSSAQCGDLGTNGSDRPARIIVEWPLSGDESDPKTSEAWAAAFGPRDCTAIGKLVSKRSNLLNLYQGLASACRALTEPEGATFWNDAKNKLVRATTEASASVNCEDQAAYLLLQALVDAHQRNPIRIEISDPKPREDLCKYDPRSTESTGASSPT